MSYGPYGQPVPPPQQRMSTGAKIGIGCLGCGGASVLGFFFLIFLGLLLPPVEDGGESTVAASPEESAPEATPESGGEEQPASEEPTEEASHPGLGEVVEHGDWEITVVSIEYDVPTSELNEYFAEEPSGQWVTVELTVKNTGSSPQSFSGNDQVLMDSAGSMYRYDLWASELFDELNPGTEGSGTLAYDVPTDFEADHMLVNGEGTFAEGVRVNLE